MVVALPSPVFALSCVKVHVFCREISCIAAVASA